MRKIDIPKELAHLKLDARGYPIPFFVPYRDGKPDFKYADEKKLFYSLEQKLCAICGKKLINGAYYFISGPVGYKNRISSDGPMHKVCAEFSMQACPHIFYQKAERKSEETPANDKYIIKEKPDYFLLICASKFKKVVAPNGANLIRYTPIRAEKYLYVNGIAQKENHAENTDTETIGTP